MRKLVGFNVKDVKKTCAHKLSGSYALPRAVSVAANTRQSMLHGVPLSCCTDFLLSCTKYLRNEISVGWAALLTALVDSS